MPLFLQIIVSLSLFAQLTWAGGYGSNTGCEVSPRSVRCRDLSVDPSRWERLDINGCSVTCNEKYIPVCLPGYLSGNNCDDHLEPSYCYCTNPIVPSKN